MHLDDQKVFIATMGATGSGKSSFINLVSGSKFRVGNGLRSCTSVAQAARTFELDGCRVVLIDMPGFDDTTRSDTDILKTIADFLKTSYKKGRLLSGILYFHRISDVRMTGAAMRNLNMFKWLCGKSFLRNVVIVTNMWGDVSPRVGHAREAELRNDDIFFRRILKSGAQMARHMNTMHSAEDIIRIALGNRPRPLRIQRELVEDGLEIAQTSAGEELNREINAEIRKYQGEIRMLEEEMQEAIRDQDDEAGKEIEAEAIRLQKQMERAENDAEKLESNYRSRWLRLLCS